MDPPLPSLEVNGGDGNPFCNEGRRVDLGGRWKLGAADEAEVVVEGMDPFLWWVDEELGKASSDGRRPCCCDDDEGGRELPGCWADNCASTGMFPTKIALRRASADPCEDEVRVELVEAVRANADGGGGREDITRARSRATAGRAHTKARPREGWIESWEGE